MTKSNNNHSPTPTCLRTNNGWLCFLKKKKQKKKTLEPETHYFSRPRANKSRDGNLICDCKFRSAENTFSWTAWRLANKTFRGKPMIICQRALKPLPFCHTANAPLGRPHTNVWQVIAGKKDLISNITQDLITFRRGSWRALALFTAHWQWREWSHLCGVS